MTGIEIVIVFLVGILFGRATGLCTGIAVARAGQYANSRRLTRRLLPS